VIPSATGSVVTGVMLAIARVAGETAPLLFTASMSRFLTTDPSEPFPSLTVLVFEYTKSHLAEQRHMASAGILVLISLIFLLNVAIRFTTRQKKT
jgi:phosphate transport system permease protein